MARHELKLSTEFFPDVATKVKTFEIRKNDRNYQVGDILELREWELVGHFYTGRKVFAEVVYMTDYAQVDNYVVMAINVIERYQSGS